ncbi:MAG TPA: Ig-like domain-containing protein [Hyalangium sp.]|nr:Ig-like domain-containing protein [Hyalangium sp.]
MASRPLSVGWCLTLTALITALAACDGGSNPPPPPIPEMPDAALSKVELSRTTGVLANGEDAVTITVRVVKSDGAALASRTVRLTVTGEGNTLAPASGQTNQDGVLTATLVSTSVGSKQVTASVDAAGGLVMLEGRPTVEFVEPPALAPTKMAFTTQPVDGTAGTALAEVRVTLQDAAGNTVAAASSAVTVNLIGGPAFTPVTVNAVSGVATFSGLRIDTAGTGYRFEATASSLTAVQSAPFAISPAAAASLELTGLAAVVSAGAESSVEVAVHDAYGNVATGYTGTVKFTSTDAAATLPAEAAFTAADGGRKIFPGVVLRTNGAQTVTVTDTATASLTDSLTVDVVSGTATQLVLSVPDAPVTAGSPFSVQVTLRDGSGNIATGYTGTVHFTSADAQAVLPPDTVFTAADAGQKTLTGVELRTAGNPSITATDTTVAALTDTASMTVNASIPALLVFSTQPANGNVRTTLSEVSVTLRDAYGNATTSSSPSVTLSLTGGNASATLSGTLTATPSSGVAAFSDLSIDQEGTGFQLVASADPVPGATSTAFTITDNLAPAAAVISATVVSSSSVRISWIAEGDDGNLGTAASYDLRYAATAITNETEFEAATPFAIPPPQAAGASESAVVTGLTLTVDHYFALKIIDGAGNSSLSNSPRVAGDLCTGVTCTPPASTCAANGRAIISYNSACVVSGGAPVCQDTPITTSCQSYETCSAGACVPVTAGSQAGSVIIHEFRSLGEEFIELLNTTGTDVDVRGYTLRNAAGQEVDIRAPSDPNGTGSAPVMVPANGVLYGIANPSGSIPAGVGFVYGAPGTDFVLADTGDALALYSAPPAGNLQDAVDFRSFVSNPDTPLTASHFVGFAGSSTQLDPASLTAAANDTATSWCVSFYPSGSRAGRVTNTQGAANGSCGVAVINELLIDGPGGEDGDNFIEIAGPGGSIIGGAKITDVEGRNPGAGSLQRFNMYTLPAGTRIPADGILLIADTIPNGTTPVPNFVPGVDVGYSNLDFEEGGGDAIQLINAEGTALLDTVGHDVSGAALAVNIATNGFAMYETATALYPPNPSGTWAVSMARSPSSADTDNNRNDFHIDPSPTPGLPNDAVNFTVTAITPDDTPAAATAATSITVTGTDFSPNMSVRVGTAGTGPMCTTIVDSTLATCSVLPSTGTVGPVSLTFVNPASVGVPNVVLPNVFTYTGTDNETDTTFEVDFCNIQFPATFTVTRNTETPMLFGRIYEAGVTEPGGAPAGILAEVGYGPYSSGNPTDPRTSATWRFFPANYNLQIGNNDEFMGSFLAPNVTASTTFAYAFRFSQDNGLRWTYCDLDGAGSNESLLFDTSQLGVMTVTP